MKSAELPIANPCHADWSSMTLSDRGRFCGQCSKVVQELAKLTEPQARALLASPPTEGLCVRYVHDATGEILFRRDVVPVGRLHRVRNAAVVALVAAGLPMAAGCSSAPPRMGSPVTLAPPPQPQMGDPVMGAAPVMAPAPSASVAPVPAP